jgi:hypothetical protein
LTHPYKKIENTKEARKAPPGQYRLLLAGRGPEHSGLYHVNDFNRAELALRAADKLSSSKDIPGWGIVHDNNGRVLTLDDGPSQMHTYKDLMKTFGGKRRDSSREFTTEHADAIEALQPERLPGWKKGDQMLVFWDDIQKATDAHARPGDF